MSNAEYDNCVAFVERKKKEEKEKWDRLTRERDEARARLAELGRAGAVEHAWALKEEAGRLKAEAEIARLRGLIGELAECPKVCHSCQEKARDAAKGEK